MGESPGQTAFEGDNRAVSSTFDDRETAASRRLCVAVALAMRPEPGTVLDLGCGTGEILAGLRTRLPDAELYGVDPVPEAIAGARDLLGPDPRTHLLRISAADLAGRDDLPPVDLALCHLNLALWPDPAEGLLAAARLLAPGGVLYAVDLARVEGDQRERLMTRAADDAERAYLTQQIDASLTEAEGQRIAAEVADVAGPELGLTARCAAGGMAGHRFDSAEAARLWQDPEVQAAVAAFGRPADGADDRDVLHWELRRA